MSEEYGKEDQNYNFWNEQAKNSQNHDVTDHEPHTEQETPASQEDNASVIQQETAEPADSTAIVQQETAEPADSTAIVQQETAEPADSTAIVQQETAQPADSADHAMYTTDSYEDKIRQFFENEFYEDEKKEKAKSAMKRKIAGIVVSAAIFGAVAGVTFSGVQYVGNKIFPKKAGIEKTTTIQNGGNKISTTTVSNNRVAPETTDVSDVVEKTMPSIVSITSAITKNYGYFGTRDSEGSGSGIIINKGKKELLIVTNHHVIADANKISVKFIDESVVEATVKGISSTADLAVLSIQLSDIKEDTLGKISVVEMGDSQEAKVGQMAIAIGNALGYGQSVTVGYISAKDREVEVENSNTMNLLQTDAAINPGNSGGALLDKDGKLIGINSAKYSDTLVEGMGYAIPISVATPIINDLMNREVLAENEKGYLGVSLADVTAEIAEAYNRPQGVAVSAVSEDGAAKEAGILVGDIITKIGDTETKTGDELKEKVNSLRAGTKVKVTLMRYVNGAYEEKVIEVTLKDKETLNSLEEKNSPQQQPNQGNGNDSRDNGQSGQQINPNDKDSLQKFFEYYFGE